MTALPTGNQVVPTTEPDWDYDTAKGRGDQSHFVRCILEGLRQAHAKLLNYGKLANIEQEEKGTPGKFLDRLREALHKFTDIDPESEEGKAILKDRFLTQLAPDIRRKLLKQGYGPNQSLDTLLQLAQTVYYGREYEEKKERQEKTKEQAEALAMAMKMILKQPEKMSRGTQVKRAGPAITVERRGTSSGIAFRHLSHSWLHVPSAKDHTGRETAPRGAGFRGQTLKTIRTESARGSPHKLPS